MDVRAEGVQAYVRHLDIGVGERRVSKEEEQQGQQQQQRQKQQQQQHQQQVPPATVFFFNTTHIKMDCGWVRVRGREGK